MNSATIVSIDPAFAIPGGEVVITTRGFEPSPTGDHACYIGGEKARIISVSPSRVVAVVPEVEGTPAIVYLESDGVRSHESSLNVGERLADGLHIVANPAVDPADNSIVTTRSGPRGQKLSITLFRLEADGYLDEMSADIMNPSGVAFSPSGRLYVTSRARGEVSHIDYNEVIPFATGLGIATGIAFGPDAAMYVGDRSGTIFRVGEFGSVEKFASLEPSVAAYHLAFGPDGRLYVTAPGLASYDSIYAIDADGTVERYARGFGRPQGLAFDTDGNCYAAACYQGRHGIVRIDGQTGEVRTLVAGNEIVGLCFTRTGAMIAATGDCLYSLPMNVHSPLLD